MHPFTTSQLHRMDASLRYVQTPHTTSHAEADAVARQPSLQFLAVEPAQRHARQFDLEGAAVAEKTFDEDFACITQTDAIERFVEGAGENDPPEARHGTRRLPMLHQPIEKRYIVFGCRAAQAVQAPGDAQLVPQREIMQAEKTPGQMQRRRQRAGTETAHTPIRRHEPEDRLPLKQMSDTDG